MEIFGHEYGFLLTVGASAKVSDLCPGGDLTRIGEAFGASSFGSTIRFVAEFIAALAKGYDDAERFAGRPVDHPPLTAEMVLALPSSEFNAARQEAMSAFGGSMKGSVEAEPSKKNKGTESN